MENFRKINLLKELENLVAFQKDCLLAGNWDDYDKVAGQIQKLENMLIEE